MANISMAEGHFRLCGNWTSEMRRNLDTLANEWRKWCYATDLSEEFSDTEDSIFFFGSGKWNYEGNLKSMSKWTKEEIPDVLENLCREMEKEDAFIKVEYIDCECGNLLLYSQTGHFTALNGEWLYDIVENENHEYTKESFDKLGIEWYELE